MSTMKARTLLEMTQKSLKSITDNQEQGGYQALFDMLDKALDLKKCAEKDEEIDPNYAIVLIKKGEQAYATYLKPNVTNAIALLVQAIAIKSAFDKNKMSPADQAKILNLKTQNSASTTTPAATSSNSSGPTESKHSIPKAEAIAKELSNFAKRFAEGHPALIMDLWKDSALLADIDDPKKKSRGLSSSEDAVNFALREFNRVRFRIVDWNRQLSLDIVDANGEFKIILDEIIGPSKQQLYDLHIGHITELCNTLNKIRNTKDFSAGPNALQVSSSSSAPTSTAHQSGGAAKAGGAAGSGPSNASNKTELPFIEGGEIYTQGRTTSSRSSAGLFKGQPCCELTLPSSIEQDKVNTLVTALRKNPNITVMESAVFKGYRIKVKPDEVDALKKALRENKVAFTEADNSVTSTPAKPTR